MWRIYTIICIILSTLLALMAGNLLAIVLGIAALASTTDALASHINHKLTIKEIEK